MKKSIFFIFTALTLSALAQTSKSENLFGRVMRVKTYDYYFEYKFGEVSPSQPKDSCAQFFDQKGYKTHYYDSDGVDISIEYNKQNRPTVHYYLSPNGDSIILQRIYYGTNGKVSRHDFFGWTNDIYGLYRREDYQYNSSGYESFVYGIDGKISEKIIKKGNVKTTVIYESYTTTYIQTYNEKGQVVKESVVPGIRTKPSGVFSYYYDKFGNVNKTYSEHKPGAYFDKDNNLVEHNFIITNTEICTYKYDKMGNWIEKKVFNSDKTELKQYIKREIEYYLVNTSK